MRNLGTNLSILSILCIFGFLQWSLGAAPQEASVERDHVYSQHPYPELLQLLKSILASYVQLESMTRQSHWTQFVEVESEPPGRLNQSGTQFVLRPQRDADGEKQFTRELRKSWKDLSKKVKEARKLAVSLKKDATKRAKDAAKLDSEIAKQVRPAAWPFEDLEYRLAQFPNSPLPKATANAHMETAGHSKAVVSEDLTARMRNVMEGLYLWLLAQPSDPCQDWREALQSDDCVIWLATQACDPCARPEQNDSPDRCSAWRDLNSHLCAEGSGPPALLPPADLRSQPVCTFFTNLSLPRFVDAGNRCRNWLEASFNRPVSP